MAQIAERAVLNGVGKIHKINPITVQAALKTDTKAQSFPFSRTWTPTRIVLKFSTGPFALLNVRYLVADASLTSEDILLCLLLVVHHLFVDTNALLEEFSDLLDGTECVNVDSRSRKGSRSTASRLMVARLN